MGKNKHNYGIYDLKLFESIELEEDFNFDPLKITKVPGGWLIENMLKIYDDEDNIMRYVSEPVFVPYHEEFI
jgi:hypothetical protein